MLMSSVSFGMQLYGGMQAAKTQAAISAHSMNIAAYEKQADYQRRQAMELDSQRKSMEVLRNAQRARSLATQAAVGQGAQFGSGLQGGYGQISGQSGYNLLGINQNTKIGENLFDINANISDEKIKIAQLGGDLAKYQGLSSLGKSLGGAIPTLSKFAQGFGGNQGTAAGGGIDFNTGAAF
jgi:hypothetical protein